MASDVPAAAHRVIRTDIPARLDRLSWSKWHRRISSVVEGKEVGAE
jgi:hypothetical protein